jgi:hypothetical protein
MTRCRVLFHSPQTDDEREAQQPRALGPGASEEPGAASAASADTAAEDSTAVSAQLSRGAPAQARRAQLPQILIPHLGTLEASV